MSLPQILTVLGMLVVVLLVLVGAWLFTSWAGKHLGGGLIGVQSGGGRIEVLDRVNIGRDQTILMVRAGERYLLLGNSPAGLALLTELTREEGENWTPAVPRPGPENMQVPNFRTLMQRLREKK